MPSERFELTYQIVFSDTVGEAILKICISMVIEICEDIIRVSHGFWRCQLFGFLTPLGLEFTFSIVFDARKLIMQYVRQWMNQPVYPTSGKFLKPVGGSQQCTQYRTASGVVSAKIGIGDQGIFRIIVVF